MSDIRHKLKDTQAQLLKLIARSEDIGEGWRQVSNTLWPSTEKYAHRELTEINPEKKQIRLTHDGAVVLKYLL